MALPSKSDAEVLFQRTKQVALKQARKQLQRTEKLIAKRIAVLERCRSWGIEHHEALLLQSNLFSLKKGLSGIDIADWDAEGAMKHITLNPLVVPHEEIRVRFRTAKKLRLGEPHAVRQLELAEQLLVKCKQDIEELEKIETHETLVCWLDVKEGHPSSKKSHSKGENKEVKPYRSYKTEAGMDIWVGKNAKGNDKMTFHFAKGSDWWLHASDYPGSHVIIRCSKDTEPDVETLNDAAELALRFSKAKEMGEGGITLSQVKWLARLKTPGKVAVSKHRTLHAALDEHRWSRLQESSKS